jgi:hypothetical protein
MALGEIADRGEVATTPSMENTPSVAIRRRRQSLASISRRSSSAMSLLA